LKTAAKLNVLINFAAIFQNRCKMLKKQSLKMYLVAVCKLPQNSMFCGCFKNHHEKIAAKN